MSKSIVSKSNELVQMQLLQLDKPLGLAEMKVANAIYSNVSPEDEDLKEYTLTIHELAELAGLDSDRLYRDIQRITRKLLSTVITVQEPSSQDWLQAAICCTAEYKAKNQLVYFQIAPKLKPHLLKLKNLKGGFTQYHLAQIAQLQSKHSLRLYELLRQFLPLAAVEKGQTSSFRDVSVDELKGYLGIHCKYARFNNFREKVLEPTQKELGEKADLKFSFTTKTKGRKVIGLKFLIQVNKRNTVDSEFEPVPENEITGELLPECNDPAMLAQLQAAVPSLAADQAVFLVNNYSREILMESLLGLFAAIGSGQIKTTPEQYLMGIIKNKQQEATDRPPTTTDERLTDRSWAD